jgi:ribosomal protein S10
MSWWKSSREKWEKKIHDRLIYFGINDGW